MAHALRGSAHRLSAQPSRSRQTCRRRCRRAQLACLRCRSAKPQRTTYNVQHACNVKRAACIQRMRRCRTNSKVPSLLGIRTRALSEGVKRVLAHFHGHLRLVWSGLVWSGTRRLSAPCRARRTCPSPRLRRRQERPVPSPCPHGTARHGVARQGTAWREIDACIHVPNGRWVAGGRRTNPNLGYAQEP